MNLSAAAAVVVGWVVASSWVKHVGVQFLRLTSTSVLRWDRVNGGSPLTTQSANKDLVLKLFQRFSATLAERAGGSAKPPVVDMGPLMEATLGKAMGDIIERYLDLERERLADPGAEVGMDEAFMKRWGPRILAECFAAFVSNAGAPGMSSTPKGGAS